MTFNVKIEGDEEILENISGINKQLNNLRDELAETAEDLVGFYSGQVFWTEGEATGRRWAPLVPWYAAWKAASWPGRGKLVMTGSMQKSFNFRADSTSAVIFNTDPKFKKHQLGEGRIPARPMLRINKTVKDRTEKTFGKALERKLKKYF